MTALALLPRQSDGARTRTDRLELLSALIGAPTFDPLFRGEVIRVPAEHPTYRWGCSVPQCARAQSLPQDFCAVHDRQWAVDRDAGVALSAFLSTAVPAVPWRWQDDTRCRICPDLPASSRTGLCTRHRQRWNRSRLRNVTLDVWCATQQPLPGHGVCVVLACPELADTPVGLCVRHQYRYDVEGCPGGAALPKFWGVARERPVVDYTDKAAFRRWCRDADPIHQPLPRPPYRRPRSPTRQPRHRHRMNARHTRPRPAAAPSPPVNDIRIARHNQRVGIRCGRICPGCGRRACGRSTPDEFEPFVEYCRLRLADDPHTRAGIAGAARIVEAAGARQMFSGHQRGKLWERGRDSVDDLIRRAHGLGTGPGQVAMAALHIVGATRMAASAPLRPPARTARPGRCRI